MCGYCLKGVNTQEVITEKCLYRYIQKGVVTHAPTWLHTDGLIRNLPKPVKECKFFQKQEKKNTSELGYIKCT